MATLVKIDGSEFEVTPGNGSFTLGELQAIVGGYVEVVRFPSGNYLVMDEDGKMKSKAVNARATLLAETAGTWPGGTVVGDVLICNASEMGK